MTGKLLAGFIVIMSLAAGIAIYYLQVFAYYEEVSATGVDDVQMTLLVNGQRETILYEDFSAIDADSSPIRFRACFTTPHSQAMLSETFTPYEGAEPLVAPGWFDCFDAKEIGRALEDGQAMAFMGHENIEFGIDRVVAVLPDGRGFAWHQINDCGTEAFDGKPNPDNCPISAEGQ